MLKSAQTSTKEKKTRYVKNQKDGTKMIEKMSNFKNSNKNKDLTVLADSLLALFMSVWGGISNLGGGPQKNNSPAAGIVTHVFYLSHQIFPMNDYALLSKPDDLN